MTKLLFLSCFAGSALWAQGTVTIFGTVTDASGSVIPSAMVKAVRTSTGAERQTTSDVRGDYSITQLPAGVYNVSAEAPGFRKFLLRDISMEVDQNRQIPIALEVGNLSESVSVRAEAAQVETLSGTIKEVVDSKRIQDLPLNGRNALDLQLLIPGSGAFVAAGQGQNNQISVNGMRSNSNNYTLDGGDNNDPQFNAPSVFPNPDALAEFAIQSNSYAAEFGRNSGIQVNAISKSGTNQVHGSLFEFLRNEDLNARNFFANTVPPFRRNQFGGTFGAPIVLPKLYSAKNKTFLFFSWQSTRSNSSPSVSTASVPSAAKRVGIFTTAIKDPANNNQPFPNNTIPANRISPIEQKFLDKFVPLPNTPSGLFVFAPPVLFNQDQALIKVDHEFSAKNRLSGRYIKSWELNQQSVNNLPDFYAPIYYANNNVTATDTYIFSPSSLNVLTFTYNDIGRTQSPHVPGNSFMSDLGAGISKPFTRTDIPASMNLGVTGYFTAFARFPLRHFRHNMQITDKVNLNRGAHLLKFGVEYRRTVLDVGEFPSDCTCTFNGSVTGDAMADFLLDRPASIGQSSPALDNVVLHELGVFAQDDWRVSPHFTINAGIRWDPYIPYHDGRSSQEYVLPGAHSTLVPNAPPGLLFASGDSGIASNVAPARWAHLAPRFGFAFDPESRGRTSIRGGYGVFFSNPRSEGTLGVTRDQPYTVALTINTPAGGLANPYTSLPGGNPFPYTPPSTPDQFRKATFVLPDTVTEWSPDFTPATIQQWNLNVQREFFGSYVLTAAYVGSKGNHLQVTIDENPAVFGPGATNANTDARRPLAPYYSAINSVSSASNSTYHSLQLSLNKRFTRNFTVLASYTWSKMIDDSSPTETDEGVTMNPRNLAMNRGLSNFDLEHRFVASYVWDLPTLAGQPPLVRQILGGWETNGIVTLQDGLPLTITAGQDRSLVGANRDRADLVGNPYLPTDHPRDVLINQYFNTTAFALPALGTFGTSGRNIIFGPGLALINFGVFKVFRLAENHVLHFRSEFFDLSNRVNLGTPNTTLGGSASSFGKITSAGDPRVIQFALRYQF
jgi:hypothetical protein